MKSSSCIQRERFVMAKNKMVTCKTCGQEIAKSAKVCPNCGAKQKGGKLKIILIVVVALIVIGALSSGGNKSKKTDSSSSSEKTEQAAEQKTNEQKPEEEEAKQKPEEKEGEATKETQAATDETLIRDDFKQAMDSYEAFFDEYVETMRLYKEDPTNTEVLSQYSDILMREAKMLKEFDEWESEDMTTAETAYYLEVQSRIYAKLATVE
jgi:FtsZ-interacting cell division protein ZipA